MPLGEAVKGSGQCTVGSAVLVMVGDVGYCFAGPSDDGNPCHAGNDPYYKWKVIP